MDKQVPGHSQQQISPLLILSPNLAKPVWNDQQMACDQCRYNDQDVDTFPCAKCHTRN